MQYDPGGGQLVELPGRADNPRNCNCCQHGSVYGGVNLKIYPGKSENELWTLISLCTGISLYIPIIWLFQIGTHWPHC